MDEKSHLSKGQSEKDIYIKEKGVDSSDDLPRYAPPSYDESSSPSSFQSPVPSLIANASKFLTIQANGTKCIRLPRPCSALETLIFEGNDTTADPVYISTRGSKRSGNAVLSHSQRGDLLATKYKFGPGREPKICFINGSSDVKSSDDEDEGALAVKTKGHMFSYKVDLTVSGQEQEGFNWQYMKTQTSEGKARVLALVTENAASSSSLAEKALAVLLRTDSTRTPGTSKWDAGNGGHLIVDSEASMYLDESIIVATCMMMLKKEIDRQRGSQIAVMGAAAGGAGG